MRRLLMLGVGLIALASAPAHAGRCSNILLGDSLAVGMAPYARQHGYTVVARQGAGVAWLRAQTPRCADTLVLMFGTNDLRGMRDGEVYAALVEDALVRWSVGRRVWATPGCFSQDKDLEAGSLKLNNSLQNNNSWVIDSGREYRCHYPSNDGVHPNGRTYQIWWEGINERIG